MFLTRGVEAEKAGLCKQQWCDRALTARVRLAMLRGDMGTIRYEPGGAVESQGWPGVARGPRV